MITTGIKAFIFDMDGTVIDSTKGDFLAWQKMLSNYNVEFSYEQFLDILGAKGEDIVKIHLSMEDDEIENFLQKREQLFRDYVQKNGIEEIVGVGAFLKAIKDRRISIALATGAANQKLDFLFDKVPLRQYFDVIVTADQVKKGKPDPEIFLQAAKALDVIPRKCVVVEDAQNGILAAHRAEMQCIVISSTHPKERLKDADMLIDYYKEVDLDKILG